MLTLTCSLTLTDVVDGSSVKFVPVFAATALVDEPVLPTEIKSELTSLYTPGASPGEQGAEGQLQAEGLLPDVEALSCRMTPLELGQCSAQQLVQIHEQLGGMMRHVVVELQTRLCQTHRKP